MLIISQKKGDVREVSQGALSQAKHLYLLKLHQTIASYSCRQTAYVHLPKTIWGPLLCPSVGALVSYRVWSCYFL